MKYLIILLLLLIPTLALALPAAPPYSNFGNSLLTNPDALTFTVPAGMTHATTRLTVKGIWTACNGNSGDYTWTNLNSVISQAISAGVKVVLDTEFGVRIPDCEITRLAALTPSGIFTTKWNFNPNPMITQGGSAVAPGATVSVPIPWNATYLADVQRFKNAEAAQIAADSATSVVVGDVNNQVTYNDDELTLPNSSGTGTISCNGGGDGVTAPSNAQCTAVCGSSSCTTPNANDVANWVTVGYLPSLPASAVAAVDGYTHTALPNISIHHMILRNRFPGINSSGVATGVADLIQTPRLLAIASGAALPTGFCEYQVNNMGYSNGTGNPNMADASNVASNTGCWVGFQSNGSGLNNTDAHFVQASNSGIQYAPCFMEWYNTEWTNEATANQRVLTFLENEFSSCSNRLF